ncbi:zinc carboxypeptidase [Winogradskyella epiphytica]|uniref:Zinc carboxypeptidase n=1 Tax=Winogradskyella epiphytica TaxID=262005 RepID=A0A2V4XFS0_9FLAO|nr:M14 metallopeptidase family protein [Winogradskyella epiphytica]PYE81724.1 zinc carboxypeptidase [Winogradskyella epiphytica]GGW63117.1 peptidase M14 [Winogradskyella epiphytica]
MNLELLNSLFFKVKTADLFGRYITNSDIEKSLEDLSKSKISIKGYSVENRPIYSLKFGHGPIKILLWSQMHGNESTSTKALLDCFNLFEIDNEISNAILNQCTLVVIPILNPDGAELYTRLNANQVDLNRDAQDLSQPESKVLRSVYNDFKPDFCFNLHGQRTIFGAGEMGKVASLSFLSPSQDANRWLTPNRKVAMSIIAVVNELLQKEIPNGVGRYDDGFNLNCVGDTFQNFGVPTLLYEAGHFHQDYKREEVRRLMFIAIIKGLHVIATGVSEIAYEAYFQIPENTKCFYDIIIRNAKLSEAENDIMDIAIQYQESLIDGEIKFVPRVEKISILDMKFGHREINAKAGLVVTCENLELKEGYENDFVMINNERISLKP